MDSRATSAYRAHLPQWQLLTPFLLSREAVVRRWFAITFIFNFPGLFGTLHAMNLESSLEFPLGSWPVESSSLLFRSPHSIFLAVIYSLNTFWEAIEQEKQLPAEPGEIWKLSLLLLKGRELGRFANDHHLVSLYTNFLILGRVMSSSHWVFQWLTAFLILPMLLYKTFLQNSLILGDILGHAQMGDEKPAPIIMTWHQ